MTIKIESDKNNNIIAFVGKTANLNISTPSAYPSRMIDSSTGPSNTVNIINKFATATKGIFVYELFNVPYTDFVDSDNNSFSSASDVVDYISGITTEKNGVLANSGERVEFLVDNSNLIFNVVGVGSRSLPLS